MVPTYFKKQIVTIPLVLVSLLSCSALLQYEYDKASPTFSTKIKVENRDLLPEKMLQFSHFGFRVLLADLYWIRAIQDYVAWDNKELFFLEYFKNISTLDPLFEHPYLFAIWTTPTIEKDPAKRLFQLDRVAAVAERGIEVIPSSWQIPYHLGTQYYLFTKEYTIAKKYLKIAAEKEGAPAGVYLNYSSFVVNDIKGYRASHDLIKVIYDTTEDETLKKIIGKGLDGATILAILERGILAYKTTNGVYPKNTTDMEKEKFISLPPLFLEKYDVLINRNNGSFKVVERK